MHALQVAHWSLPASAGESHSPLTQSDAQGRVAAVHLQLVMLSEEVLPSGQAVHAPLPAKRLKVPALQRREGGAEGRVGVVSARTAGGALFGKQLVPARGASAASHGVAGAAVIGGRHMSGPVGRRNSSEDDEGSHFPSGCWSFLRPPTIPQKDWKIASRGCLRLSSLGSP